MSEIRYDETQLNKLYRREAGIWAFRVLELVPEGIVVQLPKAFGENKTTEIPLSPKTKAFYKVGDYADIALKYTVSGGVSHSFQARYIGPTPPQFIPINGENISKI
ncbi:MAG: hypothetical protein K1W28_01625 [Lachnospiraceae bacterium]